MSDAVVVLAAVFAVVAVFYALDRAIESDMVGMYLILGASAFDVWFKLPRATFGEIAVDPVDLLCVLLAASLVARLLRGWQPSPIQVVYLLIAVLLVYSIFRGTQEFSIPAAFNEARDVLYFTATVLYASFMRADLPTRERVAKAWLIFCGVLVGIALVRWGIVLGRIPLLRGPWYSPDYWGLRVVNSGEALSLSQGFLILLPRILRGEATFAEKRAATVFALCVLVLQHRSVYAVLLLGTAVMLVRHRFVLSRRVVMGLVGSSLVLSALFVTVLDTEDQLATQASTADASSTVTFEWRAAGWAVLLRDSGPDGIEEFLFGAPYGAGYERVLPSGERVDVAPHNQYLETMLRIGVVGLLLLVGVGVACWVRLRTVPPREGAALLDDSALSVLLVTFALYMIPYNLPIEQGLLLGLAMSAWGRLPPVRSRSSIVGDRGFQDHSWAA